MGVPIVTKRGDRLLSHQGEGLLHNVGLSHWIAQDDDDYLSKAVAFASDLESLSSLRATLRQQMLVSPLCDAARFARHFEDALWAMWNLWRQQHDIPT
jgi:predicted O-linked N-acetylglucosamine transferase (SPINDLY family)